MSSIISSIVSIFKEKGLKSLVIYFIRYLRQIIYSEIFIIKNLYKVPRFKNRHELFSHSINKVQIHGLFSEFGVYKGESINYIASLVPEEIVYGFDSFMGLPEDFTNKYKKGEFRLNKLPLVLNNIKLIVGLFQESLDGFLKEHRENIAFIHMDADLYSSTKYVLFKLANEKRFQKGTVIQFDELFYYPEWWIKGEYKAFLEFVKYFNVKFQYIGHCSPFNGKVSVKILDIKMNKVR